MLYYYENRLTTKALIPVFFGRGGIDTQKTLPQGTADEVEEEVKRAMDIMGPGGGFVFGPVHRIQADVPIENMIRFFEAVERYREGSHYCYSK